MQWRSRLPGTGTELRNLLAGIMLLVFCDAPLAQQVINDPDEYSRGLEVGETWGTILCGLPGDAEHRQRLTKATTQLAINGAKVFGISVENLHILVGDSQMQSELESLLGDVNVSTRESIEATFQELATRVSSVDRHWVFVLGHGNLYGKRSLLNIEGPDIDQHDFSAWVNKIECRQRVIWAMQPTSGFWLRPLAVPNSVLISATMAGYEITATEMAYALGDVLAEESDHQPLEDIDQDDRLTLLDLYLATCLEVTGRFAAVDRLQTEHAQLDDNGDGRGKELQNDFLPDAPKSRLSTRRRSSLSTLDGQLARSILITPVSRSPE